MAQKKTAEEIESLLQRYHARGDVTRRVHYYCGETRPLRCH